MKYLLLFLLLASPLAAQSVPCKTVTATRAAIGKDSVQVQVTARCKLLRDTLRITRTDTLRLPGKTDTLYLPKPDTAPQPPPPPPPTASGCRATDLVCDDFEDGSWYTNNCDQANSSGGLTQEDGWCGSIYGAKLYPTGAFCGNVGFRSNCAASRGRSVQAGDGTQASISLKTPAADSYTRMFIYYDPGYTFGAEKVLTFNKAGAGSGGIYFGNLHINCGGGGGSSTGRLMWQPVGTVNGDDCYDFVVLTLSPGRWYYMEVRLNTAGRTLEIWADDCGATGTTCPATPTKRINYSNYTYATGTLGSIWLENWSNPGSSGTSRADDVRVSPTFIGFKR